MIPVISLLFILIIYTNVFAQAKQGNSNSSVPKVWGNVFGDYFYKAGGDSSFNNLVYSKYKKDFNAFAFRRVNLGVDYSINENFDTRVSISYDGPDTLSNGNFAVYVRDAFITWKNIFKNSNLTFGIMPTPGYVYISEKWWGHRSIEQTILGQRNILGSRDFGIMLSGTFDDAKNFGYYAMIGNGRGTRLENNKYKKFYATLFGYFMQKKMVVSLYSDYEFIGNGQSKTTPSAFLGYQSSSVTIGLENFFQFQKNFNTSTTAESPDIVPYGMSFFVIPTLMKEKLKLFLRYDFYNPDINNSSTGFNQSFFTAGLDFIPFTNVHIMPNLWLNAFTAKTNQTQKITTDVVPRITFWYEYR
ncbi:MAG: OprO/OprP family phosphate-selective porin [Bacteroidota bacterium]|nr:OprO/OprP family phosphate-selective porin [Bacteroidota bacterium]